jgi:hypothetical protein
VTVCCTVTCAVPLTDVPLTVARIVAVPGPTAVTTPVAGATVAIASLRLVQLNVFPLTVPLLALRAVALSVVVAPKDVKVLLDGVTATDATVVVSGAVDPDPPHADISKIAKTASATRRLLFTVTPGSMAAGINMPVGRPCVNNGRGVTSDYN